MARLDGRTDRHTTAQLDISLVNGGSKYGNMDDSLVFMIYFT